MLLAQEILLRPNDAQARLMAQYSGYARWTFNALRGMLLDTITAAADTGGKWPNVNDLGKDLRRERPDWALALSQNVFDNARRQFDTALSRWRDWKKGKHDHAPATCGFPAKHSRDRGQSFEATEGHSERIRIDGKKMLLPGIGWVRMSQPLREVCWPKKSR